MFPWYLISNFLEELSSLSHSIVCLYFFALITGTGVQQFPGGRIYWASTGCREENGFQDTPEGAWIQALDRVPVLVLALKWCDPGFVFVPLWTCFLICQLGNNQDSLTRGLRPIRGFGMPPGTFSVLILSWWLLLSCADRADLLTSPSLGFFICEKGDKDLKMQST